MTPARICVFAGSSAGGRDEYRRAADALGRAIAGRGLELVFGGGDVGLMGAVSDAAMTAGGHVIGVIPENLVAREVHHRTLPDLRVVGSMHERKALMAELSGGFIALPGGIGTAEELFEVYTWAQLGLHDKPVGLLDAAGYYRPLIEFLDRAVDEGFLSKRQRGVLHVADEPDGLLDAFESHRPPRTDRWLHRGET